MPRRKNARDEMATFPATVVIDTREQLPFIFGGIRSLAKDGRRLIRIPTMRGTLSEGDYSLFSHEHLVSVERKSLSDLFGVIGHDRERFEAELLRLNEKVVAAVVVESDWRAVFNYYPSSLWNLLSYLEKRTFRDDGLADEPRALEFARWLTDLQSLMQGPPPRSALNPKTVAASVLAWEQRFPRVHWHFSPNRRWAEVTTFKILERFLRDCSLEAPIVSETAEESFDGER